MMYQRKSVYGDAAQKARGCDGKIKFADHATAEEQIAHMQRKGGKRKKRSARVLTSYGCRFCGCVHIGHKRLQRA